MMDAKEYYNMLNSVKNDTISLTTQADIKELMTNGQYYSPRISYENNATDNKEMCEDLIMMFSSKCTKWHHDSTIDTIISNIKLLGIAIEAIGATVPVVLPNYDDVISSTPLANYTNAIKRAMVKIYKEAMVNTMSVVLSKLEKQDYRDLRRPFVTNELKPDNYTVSYLYNTYSHHYDDDRSRLEFLLSCFDLALRYQADKENVKVTKYKQLVDFDKLLVIINEEIDIGSMIFYLDRLVESIIEFTTETSRHHGLEEFPFFPVIPYYTTLTAKTPDITRLDPNATLLIQIFRSNMVIYMTSNDLEEVEIAEVILYDFSSEDFKSIRVSNLYEYQDTGIGGVVTDILKELGMDELVLQEPK